MQERAVGTPLIALGPALVANSLCRGQEKRTMRESEVQIGNSGLLVSRSSTTKQMCDAAARGEQLRLTEAEVAFYDATEVNDSAVKILGDETLRMIARQLVEAVRKNTTIDWTVRQDVRAHLRVLVKRICASMDTRLTNKKKATLTVLEQAEVLSANSATA